MGHKGSVKCLRGIGLFACAAFLLASGLRAQFTLTHDWRTEHADWAKVDRIEDLASQCRSHQRVLVEGITLGKLPALPKDARLRCLWLVDCRVTWAELAAWPVWETLEEVRLERTWQESLHDEDYTEPAKHKAVKGLKSLRRFCIEEYSLGTDELIAAIPHGNLEALSIDPSMGRISPAALKNLARCTKLRHLRGLSASDDGKALLAILKTCSLQSLDVDRLADHTPREVLMAIAEHRTLEALWLRGSSIHDIFVPLDAKFFERLAANTGLKTLHLEAVDFGQIKHDLPYQLSPFVDLPALKHLGLIYPVNLNKAWLPLLKDMPLTELLLYAVPLTDADIEHVGKCATLSRLTMMYAPGLTHACVSHLAGLQGLEALAVDFDLSREAFLTLTKLSKLVVLETDYWGDPIHRSLRSRLMREWWSCPHRLALGGVEALTVADVAAFCARFSKSSRVAASGITIDGMSYEDFSKLLGTMPGLAVLSILGSTELWGDTGTTAFRGRSLEFLSIGWPPEGMNLSMLRDLRGVRHLELHGTLISGDEVDLSGFRTVTLKIGGGLEVEALLALARIKSLNRLELSRREIVDWLDDEDLQQARKLAPNLTIVVD